jgi:exonuclease SbcD
LSSQHAVVRILFLADTHLGFDLPFRPRVERRRRGDDFFANLERALQPAYDNQVDAVIHGGDLYYRTRVPAALIERVMAPLVRVAERGVPLFIVPGNHERSRIPQHLWTAHPNLHIFDRPRTYTLALPGATVALAGFPFARAVRDSFRALVGQTGYQEVAADLHLLCLHQTIEGAQVGPSDYTFRHGPDVVRGRDIPPGFAAVLAGHIHRAQVLTHDLSRRPLAAPVIYPGSIERTSFAERHEDKGCYLVTLRLSSPPGVDPLFVPLPARPMVRLTLDVGDRDQEATLRYVRAQLAALDPEAVVRVQLEGTNSQRAAGWLTAARLRELSPASMNVSLPFPRTRPSKPGRGHTAR